MANYLDYIDEEIRDIIKAINNVAGIETLFSCAGYGQASYIDKRHPNEIPKTDPFGHKKLFGQWEGYITIAYDTQYNYKSIHQALTHIVDNYKPSGDILKKQYAKHGKQAKIYSYYIRSPSIQQLKIKWNKIRKFWNA